MGIPQHYSRDIAQRCQALIRHLLPAVQKGLPDDHLFGGPLGTTFLPAIATPMIVLPLERMFKPARPGADLPADDRQFDPGLADRIKDVLGPARRFADAPFVVPGRWGYVPGVEPFQVAGNWPSEHLALRSSAVARPSSGCRPCSMRP